MIGEGETAMVLDPQRWMELRRFRALHEAGATVSEIARETGLNRRTVKKYLSEADAVPPAPAARARLRTSTIDPFAHVIDGGVAAQGHGRA